MAASGLMTGQDTASLRAMMAVSPQTVIALRLPIASDPYLIVAMLPKLLLSLAEPTTTAPHEAPAVAAQRDYPHDRQRHPRVRKTGESKLPLWRKLPMLLDQYRSLFISHIILLFPRLSPICVDFDKHKGSLSSAC